MHNLDIIDRIIDRWLQKPGLIRWSEIRTELLRYGLKLDRRVLISRVRAGLARIRNWPWLYK